MKPTGPEPKTECLIVFARFPRPGAVKTRLIPALGADGASDLHRRLTEATLLQARLAARLGPRSLIIGGTGAGPGRFRAWLGLDLRWWRQRGADLGARMAAAFGRAFDLGFSRVVLIGTDCPGLNARKLDGAFACLQKQDLVLGPAEDGGYFLIGLSRRAPVLFRGLEWGGRLVLAQTLERARDCHLRTACLEPDRDVDRPEDAAGWERRLPSAPWLSVVIPTLNESEFLPAALDSLRKGRGVEVIVADGGSSDGTRSLATRRGARVVRSRPGRAVQMNAGAARARGELLLFLHADTRLPPGWDLTVRRILSEPGVAAGAFPLAVAERGPKFRRYAAWANRRARWLGLPYGDQALFLTAETFHRLGGFKPWPLLEDLDLVRRVRQAGAIRLGLAPVVTSARRWQAAGLVRTFLVHQAILAGYWLGWPVSRLARWHRSLESGPGRRP